MKQHQSQPVHSGSPLLLPLLLLVLLLLLLQ
jgi:hypothetical protein